MSMEPLYAYITILLVYLTAETVMVIRAGIWGKKRPRDWTMPLVTIPFKLVLVCSMFEYYYLKRAPGAISIALGSLLFFVGAWFRVHGHYDLRKAFSPVVQEIEGGKLVQTGLYKHIRHPLYVGTICLFLACPVFLAARYSAVLSVVGLVGVALRIRKEERFLAEHQPGYADYKKRTWRLVPKVF
jgi:protein-S-isoprenylcysteine O-methyltransferase Ste14